LSEHFRGSGFKVFAGMLEKDAKNEVWGIPAPGGGEPRVLRQDEFLGAAAGPTGPRLHLLARGRAKVGAGPVAKNIGPERAEAIRQQFGLKVGDAVFFTAGDPKAFYKFAGEARTASAPSLA
jgi:aspartyl-tRNA synthetase